MEGLLTCGRPGVFWSSSSVTSSPISSSCGRQTASEFLAKHGCVYYKEPLEKNEQHIVQPPTIVKCQELSKELFYTRLASIPGRYESFWKELDEVKHAWRNRKELKVEDAGIAALFGLELYAWFCVGEIVGRGFTFTGYYV